jgi:Membrane bound O-acyl transferase family
VHALLAFYTFAILAGVVAAPSRGRAAVAIALAAAAAVTPWLLPPSWVFLRTVYGIAGFICVGGVVDIVRRRRTWSTPERVLRVIFLLDLQSGKPTRRHLDIRLMIVTMIYQAIGLSGLWAVVVLAPRAQGLAHWALRWGGGMLFCYVSPEIARAAVIFSGRAIGLEPPELHRVPILSATISEFWGTRWNRPVGAWLRFHGYDPLAARGLPTLGVLAAFTMSAALHAWFTWIAVGGLLALVMLAFFLLQGIFVVAERILGIVRRPRAWGRAWTVGIMALSSPLFVEPMLQCIGIT